ncbi:cytochrome P450/oxidoreductase [Petropleomorpha daqingensis]|uniref:Cytochrome P450/ferredoxin-NADP reductase n=1 Tax=Petropleomorpha daqingensis TaxID=2026353 RepID=A0A853CFA0_9ACTN|nr:cytochrome P450 [Petropleomorpha daqingensis]NYJ06107.1 cytochrome P450/ferredoxin-NADP reductase [Petropleomorpha daqingensis]
MPSPSAAAGCPFTDPQHLFDDLAATRAADGLPYSEAFDARVVSRYDEIVAALHDPGTFSSIPTVPEMPSPWRERFAGRVPSRGTLIGLDDPDHDRLRSAVNTFFVPRRLARYEPWIREQAHLLVDTFVEDGAADLKTAFALPLPLKVIAHVVGLDAGRWEWIGAALGFFLGPRDIHHRGTPEEKAQRLLDLHEHVLEVMAERRRDRRDDLISHVWDERDSGAVQMTDFEMLSLFPGLMLAGHETSSNLICTGLSHLLADPARYAAAQRDDDTRAAALEELFRFESAITGMKRLVTRDTALGGVPLRAGEHVFLAYASGSRDARHFAAPDDIDLDRPWAVPHLGFGQGVHACLGAPLARLLLRVELGVLHERLPDLRLAVPSDELERTVVSEGRGMVSLPLAWTPVPVTARATPAVVGTAESPAIPVRVTGRRELTADVVELTLAVDRPDDVPAWEPGAHIDLELPDGALRQYSLCGRPGAAELRIAVLREDGGHGGSIAVHDDVAVGDRLRVRGPRNHFRLRPASSLLFVAGGIGITPLLPMLEEAEHRGADWRLLYLARSTERMPYLDELRTSHGTRVEAWSSRDRGRLDLDVVWADLPDRDAYVYACGPEGLLAGLEDSARRAGREGQVVVERFAARPTTHGPNRPFEVVLARTEEVVTVAEDDTVLDAVNRAGRAVLSTCREGTCGTCEAVVLDGVPEHRDSVLSLEERLAGRTMMTCVSRCRGSRIVLDL